MSIFNLKGRLGTLGRKSNELIPELAEMGYKVNPTELSQAINGTNQQPKIEKVASLCNVIVSRWERESK